MQVVGKGRIIFAENVRVGFFPSPYFFSSYAYLEARSPSSIIRIGRNTHINNGFVAIAEQSSIVIGDDCLIGTKVEIFDSDFHPLSAVDRKIGVRNVAQEVNIGNEVFIGSNVKILKGVTIGSGSVIANGSIVTSNIPSKVVAAGIPAAVLRGTSRNF
jgi:maltose O-acetyltransferase